MTQKNSGFEIKAEQRQSWLSIAMVWAGGMICVPCLTGGTFASFSFLAWLNLPFFVGPVNGIIVSLILYVVLANVMKKDSGKGSTQTASHK